MDRVYPRILAIDPGTNCGYAWIDVPSPLPPGMKSVPRQSGLWSLKVDRFMSQGMRFIRLKKHLLEIEPDLVIFEQVNFPHKSTAAAAMYWGVIATIQAFCDEHGIEYAGVDTGVVKKRATGKGNAGKPLIIDAANTFFEIDPPLSTSKASTNTDDNVADAMWLLQIGLEMYGGSITKRSPDQAGTGEQLKRKSPTADEVTTQDERENRNDEGLKDVEW
jgi:Holliday junction resolvasome RuvABC endonuclease subunit